MRRKEREKDSDFALAVVQKCEYATLSMISSGNIPYGIPISPVLIGEAVYFHSATAGKKCAVILENNTVSLSCVTDTTLVPEKFTTLYKSAVLVGKCFIVEEKEEKTAALFAIVEKYAKANIHKAQDAIEKSFERTLVYKIIPYEINGKGNI